ncbi:MAG: hypothetical protein AAF394_17445 [Planctomycetota bacterium]
MLSGQLSASETDEKNKRILSIDFNAPSKAKLIVIPPQCVVEKQAACEADCALRANACLLTHREICTDSDEDQSATCDLIATACESELQYCFSSTCADTHLIKC